MRLPIFSPSDARVAPDAFSNGPSSRGSHRLKTFGECLRQWYFQQFLRLELRGGHDYFTEGSALHLLLAYHYGVKLHERAELRETVSWLQVPCEERFDEAARGDAGIKALALAAFQRYVEQNANESWIPVAVEREYWATVGDVRRLHRGAGSAPVLGDDEYFSARIDLTIRHEDRIWFVDHKFLANRGAWKPIDGRFSDYARSWQFFLQQALGQVAYGADFGGVIVQRVGKVAPYPVARDVVPYFPSVHAALIEPLGELLHREHATADAISTALANGLEADMAGAPDPMEHWLPPPSFHACGGCDFWALCSAHDDMTRREAMHARFTSRD
jgi:hypothetical protein